MTVKQLKDILNRAANDDAEIIVNTDRGEFPITDVIVNLTYEPACIDCATGKRV